VLSVDVLEESLRSRVGFAGRSRRRRRAEPRVEVEQIAADDRRSSLQLLDYLDSVGSFLESFFHFGDGLERSALAELFEAEAGYDALAPAQAETAFERSFFSDDIEARKFEVFDRGLEVDGEEEYVIEYGIDDIDFPIDIPGRAGAAFTTIDDFAPDGDSLDYLYEAFEFLQTNSDIDYPRVGGKRLIEYCQRRHQR
jgi:hypothetical protein